MRIPILPIILTLSLLANAGGIVFLCLFVSSQAHIKTLKKEKNQLSRNLSGYESPLSVTDGPMIRRSFISHRTGEAGSFAVAPSTIKSPNKEMTLVVYLHGMNSSYLEPFTRPTNQPLGPAIVNSDSSIVLLTSDYGKLASWGSDEAMSDLTQNVREICQEFPIAHIILVGTSMGGCVALTYAASAPDDIKDKLTGVVSVEGAGDLAKLYRLTRSTEVQSALATAFGGDPDHAANIYATKSVLSNLDRLPHHIKIAVVSAQRDHVVPPVLQKELVQKLLEKGITTKLFEVNMDHGSPPVSYYMDAFNYTRS